ncbi:MAG: type II toxin-antitoxin system RelE/ParE family toxin [Saprospiraceae bacterium]
MKTAFKKSFLKSIKRYQSERLKKALQSCILEIEVAATLSEIKNLKKLKGYTDYFRIRVGDYRIGLALKEDTVFFVILDHRKEFYKYFP